MLSAIEARIRYDNIHHTEEKTALQTIVLKTEETKRNKGRKNKD